MFNILIRVFVVGLLVSGCSKSSDDDTVSGDQDTNDSFDWIVSKNDLTGSDHPFPFAENPVLTSVANVTGLLDEETVAMVSFKEEVRIYPYKFISTYEVVNDTFDGESFAITYCPVTESAHCADNSFNNTEFSLIASGFRYKDNLISFDQKSNSYWSQMLMKCVKGKFENQFQQTLPMVETTWAVAKANFPDALVFTTSSISAKTTTSSKTTGDEIGIDERVFGILNIDSVENIKIHIFRKSDFNQGISLSQRIISSKNTIIVGSSNFNFVASYIDEAGILFTPLQDQFPIVMEDSSGSKWNLFGVAVTGPRKGQRLNSSKSYFASWWAWKDFYADFIFPN